MPISIEGSKKNLSKKRLSSWSTPHSFLLIRPIFWQNTSIWHGFRVIISFHSFVWHPGMSLCVKLQRSNSSILSTTNQKARHLLWRTTIFMKFFLELTGMSSACSSLTIGLVGKRDCAFNKSKITTRPVIYSATMRRTGELFIFNMATAITSYNVHQYGRRLECC